MTEAVLQKNSGYARTVLTEAFKHWSARLGLIWIGVIAFFAVFAPFIASSQPYLIKQAGVISSPLLQSLTPADVIILVIFITFVILLFLKKSLAFNALTLLAVFILTSIISYSFVKPPQIVVYEQYRVLQREAKLDWVINAPIPYSAKDYLRDYGETGMEPPLAEPERIHLFGTEQSGADVLSRMIHACRIALGIGFVATGIAMLIGVILGGLMGYFSGVVDMLGMRLVEIFEAIPTLFLLLTFVAFFGSSLYLMMVIIGVTTWPGYARFVRAEFLKLRKMEYVQSAIACGLPLHSILFKHMLPNGIAPVLVAASFGVASAILYEAILSFLGLGLVDNPSWGQMLYQAVQSASFFWWMAFFPGGAIFLTVFAYNLMGEALRDAIDPYLKKKA
jgi:peptide/nickel transport system permease protein